MYLLHTVLITVHCNCLKLLLNWVQELRRRQNYPRNPADQSRWESVSELLKNVSICALPCAKLRAIADAAAEICRLYQERTGNGADEGGESKLLGGDEFLPLFIFYVIQADMDRPCALCKSYACWL